MNSPETSTTASIAASFASFWLPFPFPEAARRAWSKRVEGLALRVDSDVRVEQLSAMVGGDDSSVVRAQGRRAQQPLSFKVALGSTRVLAAVLLQLALFGRRRRRRGSQSDNH